LDEKKSTFSLAGIAVGGLALVLTLVHFWVGPLQPEPSLEETVTDAARSIKSAAVAAWKGEEVEEARSSVMSIDKVIDGVTVGLAGIAMVLAVMGFAKREPLRGAFGAALLGGLALTLEFAVWAFGAAVLAIIALFIMSLLGFG